MFLAAQLMAVLLVRPFAATGVRGFEDPGDWRNGIWLLFTVVAFTGLVLFIAYKRWDQWIRRIVLASVFLTLVYVFYPLLDLVPAPFFDPQPAPWRLIGDDLNPALLVALVPAALLTTLLVRFPEWYVVDAVGIAISAGAIAIFGASFTPVTYLVVLVAFAVYDYVSVYKTKHMLKLADSVLDLHLPILLVVPRSRGYSFLEERARIAARAGKGKRRRRDALFIGLGDVVIPSILALTALPARPLAAVGAFAGIGAGLLVLLAFVLRGRPHAGLPTLNAGAFAGFLAGWYLDAGTWVFW